MILSEEIAALHVSVRQLIDARLANFEGTVRDDILNYLAVRAKSSAECRQDLLPLLVYQCFGGNDLTQIVPIAATWTLYLSAAHFFDDFQDKRKIPSINTGIAALGAANAVLADIPADIDTLQDILDALGSVTIVSANAQQVEYQQSRTWTKQAYLTNLVGKSASIIATGIWLGGRLADVNEETLAALRQFGLALGLNLQLSDDVVDFEEDISQGIFTLPVLEGLSDVEHPYFRRLQKLLRAPHQNVQRIQSLLETMGAFERSRRLIRAYQLQVAHFFEQYPNLERYFADYVAVKH